MLKEQLKQLRKSKKLTKKQVAESVGITERAYIAYEYGERDVSTDTLARFADFYCVTTDYLLGRNTDEMETIDKLVGEFNMTALEKKILEGYLELPDDMRGDLMAFLQKSVQEVQTECQEDF
ncbi:MAG: helix-turn-helix domain-containing protein [Clostridiales bacterium]|nr:helix-turn-helix domain-containing protein [Clostridiales bacterium]